MKKNYKEVEDKLRKYGFPDWVVEDLIKGKKVLLSYGKVKYNKRSGELTTYYDNGNIKKQIL